MRFFSAILLCGFFLLSTLSGVAQDRKLDKVALLLEQGFYTKALKKAENLIEKPDYQSIPLPYLYQSLSLYHISQDQAAQRRYPHALRNALMAYEQFYQRDPKGDHAIIHQAQIRMMHQAWTNESERLIGNDQEAEARYYVRSLAHLFDDTTGHFAALFPDGVNIAAPAAVDSTPNEVAVPLRENVVASARKHMGVPYKYGGTTTRGFDCSGFTGYAFRENGLNIPRSSKEQAKAGKKVKASKAQKGDLVVFGQRGKVTHIAMVVSSPGEPLTVIHATSSKGVMVNEIDSSSYWKQRMMYVINIIDHFEQPD